MEVKDRLHRAYKGDLQYQHAFYIVFPLDRVLEEYTGTKLDDYIQEIQ